jgi:DNA topoisomerase-3
MITIYAEKFDVGVKIAAALGGFDYNGTKVTMNNVEKLKPNLEKDVKRKGVIYIDYEGNKYAVTWGQGHMCGLKQAKDYNPEYANWSKLPLPFFPGKYEIKVRDEIDRTTRKPTGNPDPWTTRQLDLVKALFEKSEYIINATDDDREGELIFAYVYQHIGVKKPYKRVVLDSQTEEGFRDAFRHLKTSDEVRPIEYAGRGRSIADWMVGANLSAIMSLKYGGSGTDSLITIGRVQTPVLNLIVQRELAIKNFVSKPFWSINAVFTTKNGDTYKAKHIESQIEDKNKAQEILNKINGKNGTITEYEKDSFKKEVPFLYNLTTLSQEANKKYGFTAQETLNIAQELYEKGYLTYPRTQSQHLTSDMQPVVDEVIDMLANYSTQYKEWIDPVTNRNYTKRHFDTSKVESHYAIIPTKVKPEKMTPNQANLYDIVAKSLIRIIYKPASGEKTKIITEVEGEKFNSSGTVIIDKQWLVIDENNSDPNLLPIVSKGDIVSGEYEIKEGKTEPPKRYNDETLLTAMRTAGKNLDDEELKKIMMESTDGGIGTSATRAGIIETIIQRKYAERKGSKKAKDIIPTEKGMKLIEILPLEEIKSAELTADWEMRLNKVAKGQDDISSFIRDMQNITAKWVKEIQEATIEANLSSSSDTNLLPVNCPKCGKPMRKLSWGWACSGYSKDNPDACKFAIGYNLGGATISDKDIDDIITKGRSKFIKGFKKKDSDETYGAFIILDENKNLSRSWDTGIACPKCGKPIVVKNGSWGCSGWKEGCNVTIWDKTFGKVLSDKDKIDLLTKKKTKEIKGFVKKNGDTYNATLILDDDYKVTFAPRK